MMEIYLGLKDWITRIGVKSNFRDHRLTLFHPRSHLKNMARITAENWDKNANTIETTRHLLPHLHPSHFGFLQNREPVPQHPILTKSATNHDFSTCTWIVSTNERRTDNVPQP